MTPALEIEHLVKSYGRLRAVNDLSLSVEPGCILGLLGRNGAGKTTTLSCALGLARPDRGEIAFFGRPLSSRALHAIAYVAETPALDRWMTGREYVEYHRRVYHRFDVRRARELAEMFDLPLHQRVQRLSNGQKTALSIVLAFAQRADLLVLDEPTAGLDPHVQRRVLELVIRAGADGAAVVISSHQIGHIERAAEKVAIVDRGRIVVQGAIDDLCSRHKLIEATFSQLPDLDSLNANPAVAAVEQAGGLVRVHARRDADRIAHILGHLGAKTIRSMDQGLEDIFLVAASPPKSEYTP